MNAVFYPEPFEFVMGDRFHSMSMDTVETMRYVDQNPSLGNTKKYEVRWVGLLVFVMVNDQHAAGGGPATPAVMMA